MADEEWYYADDSDGTDGTVRPYALTGGRAKPTHDLDVSTQVIVTRIDVDRTRLEPEQIKIVDLCRQWQSVAEIAAKVRLPMLAVRVMLSDLLDRGIVVTGARMRDTGPERKVLLQILDGLRAL
ncbi:DUF742 domain-containing protein [Fodinicola acaciae]|uniref:DUF742 domain-containing protein n=1 Tax=Fodinicola acaciae TaxID=2681555 RepID=UPI0013D74050|nr:DUF742 domain-containing protein [Fodinicola acaciae]